MSDEERIEDFAEGITGVTTAQIMENDDIRTRLDKLAACRPTRWIKPGELALFAVEMSRGSSINEIQRKMKKGTTWFYNLPDEVKKEIDETAIAINRARVDAALVSMEYAAKEAADTLVEIMRNCKDLRLKRQAAVDILVFTNARRPLEMDVNVNHSVRKQEYLGIVREIYGDQSIGLHGGDYYKTPIPVPEPDKLH